MPSTEQVPGPYWVKVPPLPPSFLAHALHVSGHVAHLPRYGPSHVVTFHIGTSTKLAIPLNRCLLTALSIVVDSLVKRSVRLPKSSAKQGRPSDDASVLLPLPTKYSFKCISWIWQRDPEITGCSLPQCPRAQCPSKSQPRPISSRALLCWDERRRRRFEGSKDLIHQDD